MVQRILVADDDERLAAMVADFLRQKDYNERVSDGASALAKLGQSQPDVLITDIQMPTLDGFTLLKHTRESYPDCAVVVMTGYGSLEDAGRAKQLGAFTIVLPPLRDRRADIPLRAKALLGKTAAADRREGLEISTGAMDRLMDYDWPGNVRELQNQLRVAAIACINDKSTRIEAKHLMMPGTGVYGQQAPSAAESGNRVAVGKTALPAPSPKPSSSISMIDFNQMDFAGADGYRSLRDELVKNFDRSYFSRLLTETGGNVSKAAKTAGLDRKRLREKLKAAGLNIEDFR
jgi:DNA-binding NtrC family response regulator